MTLTQLAVLLLRFFSVYLFFGAFIVFTEIPSVIDEIIVAINQNYVNEREFFLGMLLLRLMVYLGLAITFLVAGRPLSRFFVRGLDKIRND